MPLKKIARCFVVLSFVFAGFRAAGQFSSDPGTLQVPWYGAHSNAVPLPTGKWILSLNPPGLIEMPMAIGAGIGYRLNHINMYPIRIHTRSLTERRKTRSRIGGVRLTTGYLEPGSSWDIGGPWQQIKDSYWKLRQVWALNTRQSNGPASRTDINTSTSQLM